MNSFKMHQRVGKDGVLHLAISGGLTEQELEIMIVYQPLQALPAQASLGCGARSPISHFH